VVAYVAPATTNSVVFALVELDKTAINIPAAMIMMTSRALRLSTQLQIMTGASSSVTMNGVIATRAACVMQACGKTWTLGSIETPNL
jgi:hypothetical protein